MSNKVPDRRHPYQSQMTSEYIHKEPECLIRVVAGYALMSDDELGMDTFVERDEGRHSATVINDTTGKSISLELHPPPIAI